MDTLGDVLGFDDGVAIDTNDDVAIRSADGAVEAGGGNLSGVVEDADLELIQSLHAEHNTES